MSSAVLLRRLHEAEDAADDLLAELTQTYRVNFALRNALESDQSLLDVFGPYLGAGIQTGEATRYLRATGRLRSAVLREAMRREGLTRSEAARRLGISRQQLTRLIGRDGNHR